MVHQAHDSTPPDDRLDRRVRSVRLPGPPADLLGRCLGTVPQDGSLNHALPWLRGEETQGARIAPAPAVQHGVPHFTGDRNVLPMDTIAAGSRRPAKPSWAWIVPLGATAAAALVAAVVGLNSSNPARPVADNRAIPEQPAIRDVPAARPEVARPSTIPSHDAVAIVEQTPTGPTLKIVDRKELKGAALAAAQMEAGEFGPAMATIRSLPSGDARDHLLAQMAMNQNNVGQMAMAMRAAGLMNNGPAKTGLADTITSVPVGGTLGQGGAGGGPAVDFQSLIQLVQSSTTPRDSWEDQGGPGTIAPFRQGVWVDTTGVIQRQQVAADESLDYLRQRGAIELRSPNDQVRTHSPLRKVSLTRLERMVQERAVQGLPPTEDMAVLAGLQRIEYVFVYPETGDLCVAGPAGDWTMDNEGRLVSSDGRRPVVLLDDLVAVLRYTKSHPGEAFGCTIDPRRDNLKAAQEFLAEQGSRPLPAGEAARKRYAEQLREKMGKQDVMVLGSFDPTTHAAAVLVEADYRMKLVGVGLEDGGPNLPSTFDMLKIQKGDKAPDLGIFRLWFTMNYDAIEASKDLGSFHLRGQAVQVQTEDGVIDANGQKKFLGKASALHQEFAHNFTKEFENLSLRYPVYGQLRNVFDAALVGALIHSGGLADQVGWDMGYFGDARGFQIERRPAPAAVDTVVAQRVYAGNTVVTQVSGGVDCNPWQLTRRNAIEVDQAGRVGSERDRSVPKVNLAEDAWWWD